MARVCTLVLVALLLGAPSVAHAAIITINPGDYPLGTDLSTMFEGLTISQIEGERPRLEGVPTFEPTTVLPATVVQSNDPALRSIGRGQIEFNYFWAIELLFDTPTNYLQMDFVWLSDPPLVYAFDQLGNLLETTYTPGPPNGNPAHSQITLNHAQPDMTRIVYGGLAGYSWMTGLTYDNQAPVSVPEPSTLLFVSMGALVLIRRRSRREPPAGS